MKNNKFSLDCIGLLQEKMEYLELLDHPTRKELWKLLVTLLLIEEVNRLVGKEVKILRMQFNIMSAGDFISAHFDR